MTISGLNPTSTLPGLASGSNLASSSLGYQLPGIPLSAASSGAAERPGILTRLRSAMRSAISELRGVPAGSSMIGAQTLAMQSQSLPVASAPVAVKRPAGAKAKFPNAKTWKDKAGNVRELGTGRILKPAAGSRAVAPAGAPVVGGTQLPANAVQTPGATVYSYDQNGNPVAPTMQQLGMTPTMLQGLEGMTGAADPDGPQLNATNQNSIGLGNGLGMGSAVPVLGQPIMTTPAATAAGSAAASTGANQTVRNENVTDISSNNQGIGGYGGWGSPYGGVATPGAPYGSSMMGNTGGWF